MKHLRVLLCPAELSGLHSDQLGDTLCVVFDILRATSTFVTALQQGARRVIPVSEITAALAWRAHDPRVLLAGERDGLKIGPALTGGITFDLGNSPREFTTEIVRDQDIVATTTNGTRALAACTGAAVILAGAFLNLSATARFMAAHPARRILLVCAGTGSHPAWEDILAAGALAKRLLAGSESYNLADSAHIALSAWAAAEHSLPEILPTTDNGRRLMTLPELREDVAFCAQTDVCAIVARQIDGGLTRQFI